VLARFAPDGVVSVGGYAAVPALVAARLRGTPLALVEPNAIPGRTHRAAAPFARRIYLGFDAARPAFARAAAAGRVRISGVPLRRALVEACSAPADEHGGPLRLLVFGGSQGARQINDALLEALPRLDRARLTIAHQTGEADRERVAAAYAAAGFEAEVFAFDPDMPARYRWADLALCRAGAITVAELALAGLPALLVPYPYAADDHQTANARALADVGAARLLDSGTLDGKVLADALAPLVDDRETLRTMGHRAHERARPEAAREIAADCRTWVRSRTED
jgi:UDP-N-acetylglucosamine--N-acetylmuramyl-(pentapeptide) pyrophosphoryl-undecaprenol N-acetylglucosamine transferase